MQRSITIMGRKKEEKVDFAKLLYPAMQVADIFIQNINLAHAGFDQRKAHVIARDIALKMKNNKLVNTAGEKIKPICVHHHLILGLQKPPIWPITEESQLQEVWAKMKMSKSLPKSAVFIHDSPDKVKDKIKSAFCPEGNVTFNPVLDWANSIIFRAKDSKLLVERSLKFGGDREFYSYKELEEAFLNKTIHPLDLKNSVANTIVDILKPARDHFDIPKVKKMREYLEQLMITR